MSLLELFGNVRIETLEKIEALSDKENDNDYDMWEFLSCMNSVFYGEE